MAVYLRPRSSSLEVSGCHLETGQSVAAPHIDDFLAIVQDAHDLVPGQYVTVEDLFFEDLIRSVVSDRSLSGQRERWMRCLQPIHERLAPYS